MEHSECDRTVKADHRGHDNMTKTARHHSRGRHKSASHNETTREKRESGVPSAAISQLCEVVPQLVPRFLPAPSLFSEIHLSCEMQALSATIMAAPKKEGALNPAMKGHWLKGPQA